MFCRKSREQCLTHLSCSRIEFGTWQGLHKTHGVPVCRRRQLATNPPTNVNLCKIFCNLDTQTRV